MKLSERLLEIFDAQAALDRAKITAQTKDLDVLGELLASAHYDGVEIGPGDIHPLGKYIHLTCSQRSEALVWLLRNGFTHHSEEPFRRHTHHHLSHPRLSCHVVILIPLAGEPE